MASKTFSGQLDQAMNEAAAEGNKILFIPQQTVGEVLPGAASELVVESDGTYSIKLAYNTYSIYHYSDVTKRKTLLATEIVVSTDTAVTTIPDLLGSVVPVTEDSVLTIQGYLDEANQAKTDAEAAQAATEALFDDFDSSVADSMALAHTDTPSLRVAFNESGRLDYGFGTEYVSGLPVYGVDYGSYTVRYALNKTGVLTKFDYDEVIITKDGMWHHGNNINYILQNNDLSNASWSKNATVSVSSAMSSDGESYLYSAEDTSSTASQRVYQSISGDFSAGACIAFEVAYDTADETYVVFQDGGLSSNGGVTISWDTSGGISSISTTGSYAAEYEKTNTGSYIVYAYTTEDLGTASGATINLYPASFVSGGATVGSTLFGNVCLFNVGYPCPITKTTTSSAITATSVCTVPTNGNMPKSGSDFTIVIDGSFVDTGGSSNMIRIGNSSNGTGLRSNGSFIIPTYQTSDGDFIGGGVDIDYDKHRFAIAYDSDALTCSFYIDGELISETSLTSEISYDESDLVYIGSRAAGSLSVNSKLKNFEILPYSASADEIASWGAPK